MKAHFILYVEDQRRSTDFYRAVLNMVPILEAPGMTEFKLSEECILGLMPESGIKKLLAPKLVDPALANGIPRAEVYLATHNASEYHARALQSGAISLSEFALRDWGEKVAYCQDLDGHILAFAEID